MPELPEAETMARDVHAFAAGRSIIDAIVSYKPIVATNPDRFKADLIGRKIAGARRMGKWVRIDLDNGGAILAHLKMTGQFQTGPWPGASSNSPEGSPDEPKCPPNLPSGSSKLSDEGLGALEDALEPAELAPLPSHCHAGLLLDGDPPRALFYKDTRKFGRLRVFSGRELETFLAELALGPDPLTIDASELRSRLAAKKTKLKAAMLDQSVVSGLGNIYADESLFAASLSPSRLSTSLSLEEAERLLEAVKRILNESIEMRGSTVVNYQSLGESGSFQNKHLVYGAKPGSPCPRCGAPLGRSVVGGRTTISCPKCQK